MQMPTILKRILLSEQKQLFPVIPKKHSSYPKDVKPK